MRMSPAFSFIFMPTILKLVFIQFTPSYHFSLDFSYNFFLMLWVVYSQLPYFASQLHQFFIYIISNMFLSSLTHEKLSLWFIFLQKWTKQLKLMKTIIRKSNVMIVILMGCVIYVRVILASPKLLFNSIKDSHVKTEKGADPVGNVEDISVQWKTWKGTWTRRYL